MIRLITALFLFLFILSSNAFAQTQEKQVLDKKFWVVNFVFVGANVFDGWSTFYALEKCPTCIEGNKLMRPIVNAGKMPTAIFIATTDVGIVYLVIISKSMIMNCGGWYQLLGR
ncbi:MAG: hypothetical protein HYT67_00365 [Candidatus Yanofskybacteria bacterium]|nr:hypothetical protein [Candidatus Yanofskybacteria bacterium]